MKTAVISMFLILTAITQINSQVKIEDIDYKRMEFEDLSFLKEELKGKNIICLGEEWHRTETFSQVKNRIIKYLHTDLGYNYIIFESSIYSSIVIKNNKLSGKERLFESLQNIWRTDSVLDLIDFIDQSEKSSTPIQQFGIDLQGAYTDEYSKLITDIFKTLRSELIPKITKTESLIQEEWIKKHRTFKKYKSRIRPKDKEVYEEMILALKSIEEEKIQGINKNHLAWLIQNRIFLCDYLIGNEGQYYREQILAKNLEWLINTIGEEEKIIIWAADLHITKSQSDTYKGAKKSMIELLPKSLFDKIYSLSLIPIESTPKKLRKKLEKSNGRFYFYSMKDVHELSHKKNQFDGQIICKKTESIDNYEVK